MAWHAAGLGSDAQNSCQQWACRLTAGIHVLFSERHMTCQPPPTLANAAPPCNIQQTHKVYMHRCYSFASASAAAAAAWRPVRLGRRRNMQHTLSIRACTKPLVLVMHQ